MSKDDDDKVIRGMGVVFFVLTIPLNVWFRAFVLYKLWGWFVVPFGVAQIGKAWAYGLAFTLAAATYTGVPSELLAIKKKLGIRTDYGAALAGAMTSGLFLLVGWVLHLCM